jgi:hypothetical protein
MPPPSWLVPQQGPGDAPPGELRPMFAIQSIDWASLGDLYFRFDVGTHQEVGFPEADGVGLELMGRLRLPDEPWLSLVAGIRNDFLDGGDRLGWTVGGFGEWGPLRAGGGIDGIHDNRTDSNVGNGYLFISYELPTICSRVGVWSAFNLWDDIHTYSIPLAPNIVQVVRTGVEPFEQTRFFLAKSLGPDGRWGDVYVAPGFEHRDGRFVFSVGYEVTIVNDLDAFVHYQQTASGDRDWSIFAGLQFHLGGTCGRPFDFVMPQRIRSRQAIRTSVDTFIF